MGNIVNYLKQIISAQKGVDVRQSMHDAIKQVYDDAATGGDANMEVTFARGTENTLNDRLTKMDEVDQNNTALLATKASKEELLMQKSRIDVFETLPEGSTSNDARLEDIKVGANGEIFNSPGDAVRGQYKELRDDFKNDTIAIPLLYSKGDISTSDGTNINDGSNNAFRSDYVVINNSYIILDFPENYAMRIYKYDIDGTFKESFGTIKSGMKFYVSNSKLRFNITKTNSTSFGEKDYMNCTIKSIKSHDIDFTLEPINLELSLGGINNIGENETLINSYRTDFYTLDEDTWINVKGNSTTYELRAYSYDIDGKFKERYTNIKNGDDVLLSSGKVRFLIIRQDRALITSEAIGAFEIFKRKELSVMSDNRRSYIEAWVQGSLSSTTGQNETQTKTLRTGYLPFNKATVIDINIIGEYLIKVYRYNSKKSFLGSSEWITKEKLKDLRIATPYIRLLIKRTDESVISPSEGGNVSISLKSDFKTAETSINNLTKNVVANAIKDGIMNSTTLSPVRNLNAIIGHADVDDKGNVYVGLEACDTTAYESADSAYAELIVFNITKPNEAEVYTVITGGEVLPYINPFFGSQETITKAWDTLAMKINDNTVRIITKVFTDTTAQYQVCRDFDITKKTFGEIKMMYVVANGNSVIAWGNNNSQFRTAFSLSEIDTSYDAFSLLVNCRIERVPISGTTYFYTNWSFGNKTHALMRSTDLITWTFVSEIPVGFPTEEVQTCYYGGKIYCVNRARWNYQNDLKVMEFTPSTSTWSRSVNLYKEIHGQERPCVIVRGNIMYIAICDDRDLVFDGKTLPRTKKRYYKVNLDAMELEKNVLVIPDMPVVYPEFILVGASIYMLANTDRRGYYKSGSDGRQELTLSYFNHSYLDMID